MERRTPLRRKTPLARQGKPKTIQWNGEGICKHGVLRGKCRSCISSRNRAYGHAVQREMHKALGGTGPTPHDEESGRGYAVEYATGPVWMPCCAICMNGPLTGEDITLGICNVCQGEGLSPPQVKIHPEAKGGGQIPKTLVNFLTTDWYRRALSQSQRSLPVGSGARPAVWCHLPGGRKVLVVDFGGAKSEGKEVDDG